MCCALCQGKLGELLVSLCYQPAPGLINVGIVAARSLKAKDLNGRSGAVHNYTAEILFHPIGMQLCNSVNLPT